MTNESTIEALLALQEVDTTTDQLIHQRNHLPELEAARAARAADLEWKRTDDEITRRIDELTVEIEAAERDTGAIDRHRDRLNAQLRTVFAPREAEALQKEISVLADRRSELDDRELLALEQQSVLDDERIAHLGLRPEISARLDAAAADLATADDGIARQLDELDVRRGEIRSDLPAPLLARYDHLRSQLGVAIARLVGSRCDGCHLDLSAAEAEAVKSVGAGQLADCPQCGRLLVR